MLACGIFCAVVSRVFRVGGEVAFPFEGALEMDL